MTAHLNNDNYLGELDRIHFFEDLLKLMEPVSIVTGIASAVYSDRGELVASFEVEELANDLPNYCQHRELKDSLFSQIQDLTRKTPCFRVACGPLEYVVARIDSLFQTDFFVFLGPQPRHPDPVLFDMLDGCRIKDKIYQEITSSQDFASMESLSVKRATACVGKLSETVNRFLNYEVKMHRYAQMIEALYDVGLALGSTLQLEEVLSQVLDCAIDLLEAKNGSLMLLDESRSELKMLVAQGLDEKIVTTTRVNLGEGISGWVAKEGRPRLLRKGIREEGSTSEKPAKEIDSAMCVPLKVKDRCVGVLNLSGTEKEDDFTQDDLQLLTILASNAASAIDNAQLYQKVAKQLSEMQILYQLATRVNKNLLHDDLVPEVLNHANKLLPSDTVSLWDIPALQDNSEACLDDAAYLRSSLGLDPEHLLRNDSHWNKIKSCSKGEQIELDDLLGLYFPVRVSEKSCPMVLHFYGKNSSATYTQEDISILNQLSSITQVAWHNADLHKKVHSLFINSISALANSIDARDPYTKGHSERVTQYSVMLAEKFEYSEKEIEMIRYASLLHDIGKIRIPDNILHKPGRLSDEEFEEMKRHPQYGVEIMEPVKEFEQILPYMLHHHERYDGRGYPHRLQGEEIPHPARMMCVADCWDAMTSDRPYRLGMTVEEAREELVKNKGTQFDPEVVEAFLLLLEEGKVQNVLDRYRKENPRPEDLSQLHTGRLTKSNSSKEQELSTQ